METDFYFCKTFQGRFVINIIPVFFVGFSEFDTTKDSLFVMKSSKNLYDTNAG